MLHNAVGWGGVVRITIKKQYEGVLFNVINVMRGWAGVKFPGKKRHVTQFCGVLWYLLVPVVS